MKWQDKPTKSGWWWYRCMGSKGIPGWPKAVFIESLDYGYIAGEYAGPIPEPPEDTH